LPFFESLVGFGGVSERECAVHKGADAAGRGAVEDFRAGRFDLRGPAGGLAGGVVGGPTAAADEAHAAQ
jgi:hypothetical protein